MSTDDVGDDLAWSVSASRHLFRDRWISIRADDCVMPSGVTVAPYYVLEYSDWVHVVALDHEGNILLVRQYRHGIGATSLELPGGMMDAADPSPAVAAMRELAEETGYSGNDASLVASLSPNPATHANRLHVVLVRDVVPGSTASPDQTEDVRLVRMPVRAAVQAALRGEMINATHVGLLFMGLNAASLLPAVLADPR